jgi:hypothetical protein
MLPEDVMKMKRMLRRRRHPAAEFATDHAPLLLVGAAAGAALLYLASSRGERYRHLAVDRTVSAARSTAGAIGSRARDLRSRTRGLVARGHRAEAVARG